MKTLRTVAFWSSIALYVLVLMMGASANAQTPNPVTPGYVIERNNQGFTQQSWQPITQSTPLPVTTTPGSTNAASTNISTTTSATPGTATQLVAANTARKVINIRVEGAGVVCFSKYTATPTCGGAGTFSLAAPGAAGNGTGGSYVTPPGITDQEAWYMVSATASVVVFAQWQ